jgi:hypothetical protein
MSGKARTIPKSHTESGITAKRRTLSNPIVGAEKNPVNLRSL